MQAHTLVWFRHDLRVADNPALAAAAKAGLPVIAAFIHAPDEEQPWAPGAASNWWLHHALADLEAELGRTGLHLTLLQGPSQAALEKMIAAWNVRRVFWNRRFEPAVIERDRKIERDLKAQGIEVETFNASLLYEPHEITNRSGQPFRVFTPFWKHLYAQPRRIPVSVDAEALRVPESPPESATREALGLLPRIPWDSEFPRHWNPDQAGAKAALRTFIDDKLDAYRTDRDIPGLDGTSRLSPYLHFGQIGPRQVWQAIADSGAAEGNAGFKFLSEIAWREFAHHLLAHFPDTPEQALNENYRSFPWVPDENHLAAWRKGMTGYPIVDAGMRQLWRTGWMHNRVRMIVASFLVKHLLQPWQTGARWFWDTLVDADLASNTMGWQWTAGCGADAAPYFRVFNPILQGEKFDGDGRYVRTFVPELARLPDAYLHQPWTAPSSVLSRAGICLGRDYPDPIIDHKAGRERALAALAANKQARR